MGKHEVISFAAGSCYSYLIVNNGQALLIDPHISLADDYIKKIAKKHLSLVGIVETHTHADHISSASLIKRRLNVPVYMSDKSISSVATKRLSNGETITVGSTEVKIMYTPGHTDESISLLTDHGDLFTGDAMLINSTGRTDFQNGSPEDMYDSLGMLAALPEETTVRPAHDYNGNLTSTIGKQRTDNPFILKMSKENFCETARSKTIPKPANIDTIVEANQKGSVENFSNISPQNAAEKLKDQTAVLLDVRTDQELAEISVDIESIKHIPLQKLRSEIGTLSSEASYYMLCKSGGRATMAATQLVQKGFARVAVIEGGIAAWEKTGLPVKKTDRPISLERQVRIIAGSLALIGSLLSLLNIWFIAIPLFVSSGLIFAGVTDNCAMGMILMKLPYNKQPQPGQDGSCSLDGGGCSLDSGSNPQNGGCAM